MGNPVYCDVYFYKLSKYFLESDFLWVRNKINDMMLFCIFIIVLFIEGIPK